MLKLRKPEDNDVQLVEIWLHKEHVKRFYEVPSLGVTIDDWIYELRERNGEFHWLTHLIATWNDHPIGLCQYYNCENSDEDWGNFPVSGSYGIDYLIGEEEYLGKGLGKGIIMLLVNKIFSLPDAKRVTADIDEVNTASEKALLSSGFKLFDAKRNRYVIEKLEQL